MGMTTLSWNAPGYSQLVINVGSATGTPLTGTVGSSGSAQTGSSVTDGLQFFLVDLTSNTPIASVTVHVNQPTSLTSISPPGVEAGFDGFKLQALGTGFTASSAVTWGGQKLATEFLNSGSLLAAVPASDLTAPETIQVGVVTDGQAPGSLPFKVGSTPYLASSMMTKSANNSGCQVPAAATSFLYSDPSATVWFSVEGAVAGDIAGVNWHSPGGTPGDTTIYWNPLPSSGNWCLWNTLDISGGAIANIGGDWQAVITWNGTQFFAQPFTIVSPPEGYYDGNWSGTTSQGLPMSMGVFNDQVTSYSVTTGNGVNTNVTLTGPEFGPIIIFGNVFDETFGYDLSGMFSSSTQASGTLGVDGGISWTATKQ
jgi:hypothetical protein